MDILLQLKVELVKLVIQKGVRLLMSQWHQIDCFYYKVTKMNDPTCLWHFCYGNLNFNRLKTLSQKKMTIGLLDQIIPSFKVCDEYVIGKQHHE